MKAKLGLHLGRTVEHETSHEAESLQLRHACRMLLFSFLECHLVQLLRRNAPTGGNRAFGSIGSFGSLGSIGSLGSDGNLGSDGGLFGRRPLAVLAPEARKASDWPKRYQLAHVFLWVYSYKRLKLAQLLGQLGAFLTCRPRVPCSSGRGHPRPSCCTGSWPRPTACLAAGESSIKWRHASESTQKQLWSYVALGTFGETGT